MDEYMIGEVSHFRVLERAGEGGMGVVYRAEDTALKRAVALKFITQKHATDKRSRERFIREAQTAASLNHPNVCTIHEVGEIPPGQAIKHARGETLDAGTPYIAMEFLEGETLRTRISRTGPLNVPDVVSLAIPIAKGLAAAHAQGIVHRDLKPSNVMISSDDQVKILDFGLAKPVKEIDDLEPIMPSATTMVPDLTQVGTVVGTVSYMSPEQVSGKSVDSRSDVFSFGTMLFEMVVGFRPFDGDTQASTAAKILEIEPTPPISEIATNLPPELVRIIRRCLRKNPIDRFNDTRDLVVALKDLRDDTSSAEAFSTGAPRPPGQTAEAFPASGVRRFGFAPITRWGLAAFVVVLFGAAVTWFVLKPSVERAVAASATYRQVTFSGEVGRSSISPDGDWIAYLEETGEDHSRVLVKDLGGGSPIEVLDSVHGQWPPKWSPNGAKLLFSGEMGGKTGTFIVPRVGGMVQTLPSLPFADWSPDGTRVVGAWQGSGQFHVMNIASGETTSVNIQETLWWHGFDWSPSERILILTADQDSSTFSVWTIQPDGSQLQKVVEDEFEISSAIWSPYGDAIFYLVNRSGDKGDLMKVPVNLRTGAASKDPITIIPGFDGTEISVSADGRRLLYTQWERDSNLWLVEKRNLQSPDELRKVQLTSGSQIDSQPKISPDGRAVAFTRWTGGTGNIYVTSIDGGEPKQITFLENSASQPVWSSDGTELAFISEKDGVPKVWRIASSGGAPRAFERTVVSGELTWAPGSKILYQRPGNQNFHLLDPKTEEEAPLIKDGSGGWGFFPQYSPDGSKVAVSWNRGYEGDEFQGVWAISTADGSEHLLTREDLAPLGWSADGEWVYAQDYEKRAFRIPASGGDPGILLTIPFEVPGFSDILPDGSQMVVTAWEMSGDLWLVENFDPTVN